MNHKRVSSLLLFSLLIASCSYVQIPNLPTATPTVTLTASLTATKTPAPTKTPRPTFTPRPTKIIEAYSSIFPRDWPLAPLSADQVNEIHDCDMENLASKRYPEKIRSDELIYLFDPKTACEWATLAYAYALRVEEDEEIPEIAMNAFGRAIAENHGFAFSTPLYYRYFYYVFPIVKQPPVLEQEITRVNIDYTWGGMGDPVKYRVDIRQANTSPVVTTTIYEPATISQDLNTNIEKGTVQALGKSLSNLLPIESQFALIPCYDNSPDWTVTMSLEDGTSVELKTNNSNMLFIGGPWQTNIDDQDYLQFSIDFIAALYGLIREIGLPFGEPMGMACSPASVLDKAYP